MNSTESPYQISAIASRQRLPGKRINRVLINAWISINSNDNARFHRYAAQIRPRACVLNARCPRGPGVIRAGIRPGVRDDPLSSVPSIPSVPSVPPARPEAWPVCLQRRRHLCSRLGASSRVSFARAPAREIFATRADYRHHRSHPLLERIPAEALEIASNVLDEAFSVRTATDPPFRLSGAVPAAMAAPARFQIHLCARAHPCRPCPVRRLPPTG